MRAAIRAYPSPDYWRNSLAAAVNVTNATEEEVELLVEAIHLEMDMSWWPKGFF